MAHYKRGRPKNRRAGCLMCKFWKDNTYSRNRAEYESLSSRKSRQFAKQDQEEYLSESEHA